MILIRVNYFYAWVHKNSRLEIKEEDTQLCDETLELCRIVSCNPTSRFRNLCIQYSDLYDEIDESDELSCYHNTTITCTNQTNHCDHQRCHDLLNG
ncbi:unnamed protein product [Rotaria sordida]|uniref:Uncharacterized protein n=1 Tax=Rotaria sordida TaxID=392033 RepID=A0A814GEF1_9BILA|nr:unnamed protein product [Rotaria sordida]